MKRNETQNRIELVTCVCTLACFKLYDYFMFSRLKSFIQYNKITMEKRNERAKKKVKMKWNLSTEKRGEKRGKKKKKLNAIPFYDWKSSPSIPYV